MEKLVNKLLKNISELEEEPQDLDASILEAVRKYQRAQQENKINIALKALEFNANKRQYVELFLYAHQPSRPPHLLRFISSQEIELYLKTNPEILETYWDVENRITLYTEFKNRAKTLLSQIKRGDFDNLLNQPPIIILYMIMGNQGELLEPNLENKTDIRLEEIMASVRY